MPKALRTAVKAILRVLLALLLLAPIPAFLVWFNHEAAESAAADAIQFENDSALALLSGQTLAQGDQLNERLVLSLLIKNLEQPFDTVALGSSRVMQLNRELAGVENFYNCGLSGADYRDIINIYYQFEKAGMLPKNIIFAIDPWILNADPTKLHAQSDPDLFREFMATRLGYTEGYTPPPTEEELTVWELLRPETFQQSLEYMLHSGDNYTPPNLVQGDLQDQPTQLKMPDGTVQYPPMYRNADQAMVDEMARTEATTFLHMDGYLAPDPDLCLLFHRFIYYVRSQGVNVIFMLTPFNPWVYNYATENAETYPGFFLTEPWFSRYAAMYDIPLYGSYNPFVTDTGYGGFYDGLHVKPEAIPGFFPGIPAVLQAQKQGEAGSPWHLGGPRVRYKVADRLVRERYAIAEPEVTVRGYDEIINGEVCYLVHRYETAAEDATLLATYAVTRRQGTVYRWATDTLLWTIDPRF